MPVQTPQWTDVLCCCICYNIFDATKYQPISLVCGHTACRACLLKLKTKQCPFDQCAINIPVSDLLQNSRILKILGLIPPNEEEKIYKLFETEDIQHFKDCVAVLESLTTYVKRAASEKGGSVWSPQLSRPMQRKLVTLLCCNLIEPDGRSRVVKAIRSLGERSLTELLLMHQNPYHLSSNLWATVRARGCQFLGPAMQEEVLKLVLLALSEGALISRKVLVMYIVQTLEKEYPQASKTSVGHVVQLLYRASCFNVIKRDGESSLMQLKEDFRTYDCLRREHDAQIVQIAMEAGLRISPDQWSALLYGDQTHKSHMQSIIDRLQTPQSFYQCIQELLIGLQRTGDPGKLVELRSHFELLAEIDPSQGESTTPSWQSLVDALRSVKTVVDGQVKFCETYGNNRSPRDTTERNVVAYKFKTSMCRDITDGKSCPRGESCTFAHSLEEMERFRARSRLMGYRSNNGKQPTDSADEEFVLGGAEADAMSEKDFPLLARKDSAAWNGDISPELEQQLQPALRKPFLISPAAFQQTLLNQAVIPPPSLPVPGLPPPHMAPAIQQIMAMDIAAGAPILAATPPPPQMTPQIAAVLAQPAILPSHPPPGVPLHSAPPFAMNAMPQIPQFGTVRYQIIRPTNGPPTQVTSHLSAPISVTGSPDFGYYWYPPCGTGQFQSRVSGEILHLEVPLARVIPGATHLLQNLPPEYFAAGQQPFPPEMGYFVYPPPGMPIRLEEPFNAVQHHRTVIQNCVATNNAVRSYSEIQPICTDNKHCGEISSSSSSTIDDKNGKLQLLEKKRSEILQRLNSIHTNAEKTKFADDQSHRSNERTFRGHLPSLSTTSVGNDCSKTILPSPYNSFANDRSCAFSNSSSTWSSVSSSPSSLPSKDTFAALSPLTASTVPFSKNVQRSLSSEERVHCDESKLYSPWSNTKSGYDVSKANSLWRDANICSTATSGGSADLKRGNATNNPQQASGYAYATRPYIPEDYIDIKHLSDDVLKKELQQLPPTSKRLYYIRLEMEGRESDCWRSEDDLVIPFSGDPHVSRYGPISRSKVALTVNSVVAMPSPSTTVSSDLVQVKESIQQPLPTASVQQSSEQYVAYSVNDSSSIDVSAIPIVFQASAPVMGASMVGEKLDKVVEMKEKLDSLPTLDGASSVEREQLKMDLDIINKEIANLDKETELEYLLNELKSVNSNIEELRHDE